MAVIASATISLSRVNDGTGIHKITTAPSSYTTTTGGYTPTYRIALSTVLTQSGVGAVLVGDILQYSYYQYPVGYVDNSYVYCGARTSIRGATGEGGIWYHGTKITGTSTTATIFSGSGISSAKVGDMYLNTSTSNTYKCTTAGAASVAKWVYVNNIKGPQGSEGPIGETGNGVSSVASQFYLSTSKTTQTGGSWVTTMPTWSTGKYLWIRTVITYTNGDTAYTAPYCDSGWEAANELNSALNKEAIFNRLTDNGTLQGMYMDGDDIYFNATYMKTGTLDASKVTVTNMNASNITSGTMSADRLDVDGVFAKTINAQNVTIKAGSTSGGLSVESSSGHGGLRMSYAGNNMGGYDTSWYAPGSDLTIGSYGGIMLSPGAAHSVGDYIYLDGDTTIAGTLTATSESTINLGSFSTESALETALTTKVGTMSDGEIAMVRFVPTFITGHTYLGILGKTGSNSLLRAWSGQGNVGGCIFKFNYNGTWNPLEWENPPMAAGVEYRTTERFNGLPVYQYFLNYGFYYNTVTEIAHGLSGVVLPISVDLFNNGAEILTHSSGLTNLYMSRTTIGINIDWNMGGAWFRLKYTKSS